MPHYALGPTAFKFEPTLQCQANVRDVWLPGELVDLPPPLPAISQQEEEQVPDPIQCRPKKWRKMGRRNLGW
eukprot:CAMPEP_0181475162 /NCGR_PEP_ID=MMETSP1110-20121109/41038_1 /TAXON_ID=174948 /ORGANISM="Symbiodinium sp., Strain CCMP421" /LENGTH=71 /DNA_ID=CAMNT_0023600383 /DNA_START=159 /DNA_END=371 /DNA_ORIENTATION=+